MTYEEVVTKMRKKERISTKDVKGYWLFYLIQDGEIKTIKYNHTLYEINLIESKPVGSGLFTINELTCSTWRDVMSIMQTIIRGIEDGLQLYITLDDEYFEVKLEALETDE